MPCTLRSASRIEDAACWITDAACIATGIADPSLQKPAFTVARWTLGMSSP
jgi:hypothetical protein